MAGTVETLVERGAARGIDVRHAEPGEFTARAYLGGRLSLTEAEGVAATIAARSDAELRAAAQLRRGELGDRAAELAETLATTLALVEAGIDFTDQDDVVAIAPGDLHSRVTTLVASIDRILDRAVGAEDLRAIPWVVLAGVPNAGKSTLFNRLLGRERAVVSSLAGTTRDVLAEPLALPTPHGAAEVLLVDLAGTGDATRDPLDRDAQAAARAALDRAELIVRCVPAATSVTEPPTGRGELLVRTRSDETSAPVGPGLPVSAPTGAGLDALRRALAERLADRAVSLAADATVLRPRHEASLRAARDHLVEALEPVDPVARALDAPELVAASLRHALDELGALVGTITPDDVLGRVFATFCVGK